VTPGDLLRVSGSGLRARPLRVVLSALGIMIGIGAMVAVLGISTSSRARLDATLDRLGTDLLTVTAGETLFGDAARLPTESVAMVARVGSVRAVSATGRVPGAKVYRNDRMPTERSGGIAVRAARVDLPGTVGATVRSGTWLNPATSRYPATVLGATTARLLGIAAAAPDLQVWLGGRWFAVIGVLDEAELAPELDNSALVGWPVARSALGFDGHPTTIYERSGADTVDAVRAVLPRTVNPENPEQVRVSRPSDALAARAAANEAFTGLLLGVGGVALLVGGIGVANTMVISVLERRSEIGLRRALGAARGQIRLQFLTESVLMSILGGLCGVLLGLAATAAYAAGRGWPVAVPAVAVVGGIAATTLIGGIAGLYPAMRAARLSPTEALATP
jgi:putative ABC transport system permease protein